MTRSPLFVLLTVAWALALVAVAPAALQTPKEQTQLTVDQIVERANRVSYYQGADGRARVLMMITDGQGKKREREFTILRWDQPAPAAGGKKDAEAAKDAFCGGQKSYIFFHRPADVNKTAFLVWKHLDKDDDRWLFLPGLNLVKRIASTDKRTSFVGSHFFYEDVSGRSINDDKHELVETTAKYYKLKNTPRKPKEVEFGHFIIWIHRKTFVVVKTEYYDKQGKGYRTYEALKFEKIQGYPTITKSRMTDNKMKGHTVLEYKDVKYDQKLPENIFTERFLKRPPHEYLK